MKICFVAHFALRALIGGGTGHIGGIERQIAMMAKWLAARGHDVSVVVWDEGQPDGAKADGVNILKVCAQDSGIPGLRFFAPRWTSLLRALREADADIYYHNCAEYVTGQVAIWAGRHGKKFVYSVASDPECSSDLTILTSYRERALFRTGLKRADGVIAQSKFQQEQLLLNYNVHATVLPMPCQPPKLENRQPEKAQGSARRVLWMGRVDPVKQAELLLAAARDCPALFFDLVGPDGGDTAYAANIRAEAAALHNVEAHGAVDFEDVGRHYRDADVLCCTSRFEGFPNTFLEAWSFGLPVVSTVDPDDLISRFELGEAVVRPDTLATKLTALLEDEERLRGISANALEYFHANHAIESAMPRFEAFFENTIRDRAGRLAHHSG